MKIALIIVVLIVAAGASGYYWSRRQPAGQLTLSPSPTPNASESATPMPSPTSTPTANQRVTMSTARGNIELELYPQAAPKTVANFVKLAKVRFYDGTTFHRVVAGFVIQGGDPLSKTLPAGDPKIGTGGPGYQFADEINPRSLGVPDAVIKQYEAAGYIYDYSLQSLPVDPGYLAMANAGPNTNGSQFFIVTSQPQPSLYGKHTVFGKVTKGMDVVLKIKPGDKINKVTVH